MRWRIRQRTIAHVYEAGPGRAPVRPGRPFTEAILLTFRVPADDLLGLTADGFPYFRADWGHNVAAAVLGDHTDWTEIAELLTDSYCEMAPKFLIARLPGLMVTDRQPQPARGRRQPGRGAAPRDR